MPRGVGTSVRQDCFVYSDNVAATDHGGRTWTLAGRPSFPGAVYGAAWMPGAPTPTLVAVGPNGIAYSADNGTTWTNLDPGSHWSVAFASRSSGWAVGPEGRVTHIRLFEQEAVLPPHPAGRAQP